MCGGEIGSGEGGKEGRREGGKGRGERFSVRNRITGYRDWQIPESIVIKIETQKGWQFIPSLMLAGLAPRRGCCFSSGLKAEKNQCPGKKCSLSDFQLICHSPISP